MGSHRQQGLLAGLIVAVVALALFTTPDRDAGSFDLRASTFRPSPSGALALYLTLDELGIGVERRLADWVDGPPLRGTLVLLAPSQPLTPFELETLLEWVDDGGALVVAAGRFQEQALWEALGLSLSPLAGDPQPAIRTLAHQWSRDSAVVEGFRWTFADDSPVLRNGEATTVLHTAAARDPVVVTYPRGAGRVVAWSDVGPLTNVELRDSGAALVFARAAADLMDAQAPIVFDEYHQGYRDGIGPARATLQFLTGSGPGRMAVQLAVAALGLLWLYGRRFGAPHDPPPAHRRSPLEHVDALAGAYRQGGARATARRLIVAGLARRLGLPVPPPGTEGEWIGRLARRTALAGPHADAMRAEWQRGPETDIVALARHADALLPERT